MQRAIGEIAKLQDELKTVEAELAEASQGLAQMEEERKAVLLREAAACKGDEKKTDDAPRADDTAAWDQVVGAITRRATQPGVDSTLAHQIAGALQALQALCTRLPGEAAAAVAAADGGCGGQQPPSTATTTPAAPAASVLGEGAFQGDAASAMATAEALQRQQELQRQQQSAASDLAARHAAEAAATAAAATASAAELGVRGAKSEGDAGGEADIDGNSDALSECSMAPQELEGILAAAPEGRRDKVKALLQRRRKQRAAATSAGKLKQDGKDPGTGGPTPKKPAKGEA